MNCFYFLWFIDLKVISLKFGLSCGNWIYSGLTGSHEPSHKYNIVFWYNTKTIKTFEIIYRPVNTIKNKQNYF